MQNKVFVGSLSFKSDNDGLKAYFETVGTVTSAIILFDKMTGRSKGFGFVEYATEAEAQAAVDKLNNTEFDGRTIFVDLARPKDENAPKGPRTGGFSAGPRR